jgi:hypothetical protein
MPWKLIVTLSAVLCLCETRAADAQPWTSTDVGSVGIAGSATQAADGSWTVQGSGADIWGTADSFQFVHQTSRDFGSAQATVVDLQNTNPFAKAGLMVRSSLAPDAATAILDFRPDFSLEFMVRATDGAQMTFIGTIDQPGAYLRLTWGNGHVRAWTSKDRGANWFFIGDAALTLPTATEAGLAVTSHDQSQLATAHFQNVSPTFQPPPMWNSIDIGDVGRAGGASETNGLWTVSGAGGDIWGTADAFQFLYRSTTNEGMAELQMRVDDMQNTNAFAKVGLMVRLGLDPDSPAVILDVTPSGNVEFMSRGAKGGEMTYLGGATVTFPIWLRFGNSGGAGVRIDLNPSVSKDGIHWDPVCCGSETLASASQYYAGAVVTSHDTSQLNTTHLEGLSLYDFFGTGPFQIGETGIIGSVAVDIGNNVFDQLITVEGAGADIWGTADSFEFAGRPVPLSNTLVYRVVSLNAANPFAKAGVMFRDGLTPSAPSVILDAKPDGGVEFMARLCGGCETTFLGGASISFPAYLILSRNGSSFTASVSQTDPSSATTIGSTVVPMSQPTGGLAVTSHDPSHIATAVFTP